MGKKKDESEFFTETVLDKSDYFKPRSDQARLAGNLGIIHTMNAHIAVQWDINAVGYAEEVLGLEISDKRL